MNQKVNKNNQKHRFTWAASVLLLSVLMTGCGPDLRTQCKKVQKAFFDGQNQRQLGSIDRAAMLENAKNHEKLSATFQTIKVQDGTLKKSVKELSVALKEVATAIRSRAEISDADGISRVNSGDTQAQQKQNSVRAKETRAYSKVQTSMEQIGIHCNLR